MNNQLHEERLSNLLPALSLLAQAIGTGNMPDKPALEAILLRVDVEREEWALGELECWSRLLDQARTASNVSEQAAIIEALKGRGIPETSASLATDVAIGSGHPEKPSESVTPFSVEPQSIDFGCLKPGEQMNATLKVRGGPGKIIVHNDRLNVAPSRFGSETTELQVTLLRGSAGELIYDNILVQAESGELKVLVVGWWEEEPMGEDTEPARGKGATEEKEEPRSERTFKGRACPWCGKNIRYDIDSGLWKECENCKGARVIVSVILRISREFWLGTREFASSMVEVWEVLSGKGGWKKNG